MTTLQTVAFGAASDGSQGDTVRTAFSKVNTNTAVLQSQAALSSGALITQPTILAPAQIGQRININLSATGTITFPLAGAAGIDSVMHLRNTGTVTAVLAPQNGDTLVLTKLAPGEAIIFDTDGVHTWAVLMRGRAAALDEAVAGNLSVGGTVSAGSVASTGNVSVGGNLVALAPANPVQFPVRPQFNGNAPYDTGNLVAPLTSADNLASVANKATARTNLGVQAASLVGMDYLGTYVASSGVVDFSAAINGALYDSYHLVGDGITSNDSNSIGIQLKDSTGAWNGSNYYNGWIYNALTSPSTVSGNNATGGASLLVALKSAANNGNSAYGCRFSAELIGCNMGANGEPPALVSQFVGGISGNWFFGSSGGQATTISAPITGARVVVYSGAANITSGRVRVYGHRKGG